MTRRSTGPTTATRDLVFARDRACIVCEDTFQLQIHHRRPRGMGGTRRESTNSPAALVLVCSTHHAWLESHRDLARQRGYLVPQHAEPADVPILHRGVWSWLCDDGTVVPLGVAELADLDGGAA